MGNAMNHPQSLGLKRGGPLERERDHIRVVATERQRQSRARRKNIVVDEQLYSVRGLARPKCEIRMVRQTMLNAISDTLSRFDVGVDRHEVLRRVRFDPTIINNIM